MNLRPTVRALVQRGFATTLADTLARNGYSLARLKRLSNEELGRLCIPADCYAAVRGGRPPIPLVVLHELLYNNSNTCCVCHEGGRGIVVHHIRQWSESFDHSPENLAVLCLQCHNEAHTRRELTHNLTPAQLRHHKQKWEQQCTLARNEQLFETKSTLFLGACWDYFNPRRLVDCGQLLGIPLANLPGYTHYAANKGSDKQLPFRFAETHRDGSRDECDFLSHLLRTICTKTRWVDLAAVWTRTEIRSMLKANTIVALTGRHRFKSLNAATHGPGQTRVGYYARRRIRLEFAIDAWDCTSTSSHGHHLRGQWVCTSIGFVRSVSVASNSLIIQTTCLAIGTGFTEYFGVTPQVAYTHGDADLDP